MSRRKRHAYGRSGLFEFAIDGIATDIDNPLLRECPRTAGGCGAAAGQRCTRPARGGRIDLKGYHPARQTPDEPITSGEPHAPSAPPAASTSDERAQPGSGYPARGADG